MTLTAPETAPAIRRVGVADGRVVQLRHLAASDEAALRAALTHADPIDLRRRFLGPPPPASTIVRQLRRVDDIHDLALGAFDELGRLIAVAQLGRLDDEPTAEFAIEVGTGWKQQGLGRIMLDELIVEARALGISRLTASYYADNVPVRRLIHGTGRVVESGIEMGVGYAVLDITG